MPDLAIEQMDDWLDFRAFVERVIDNSIKRAPMQRVGKLHRVGAVCAQAHDIRRKLVSRFTAIQHGHAVSQAHKPVYQLMTQVARSAYHENIHNPKARRSTRPLLSSIELTVEVRLFDSDTDNAPQNNKRCV